MNINIELDRFVDKFYEYGFSETEITEQFYIFCADFILNTRKT